MPFAEESGGLKGEEEEEQHDVDNDKHLLLLVVTTQIWNGVRVFQIFVKEQGGWKRGIVYVEFVLSLSRFIKKHLISLSHINSLPPTPTFSPHPTSIR
jgi:hypothetical protein